MEHMVTRSNRARPCRKQLEALVHSIGWSYSIFWHLSPDQGVLVWGDGFYNGDIKTRKTVQPIELTTEELCVHRTLQLRELYDCLCESESAQPARRPCAALSPEDLSDSEWYYIVCMSYSFAPGFGLPGRAFASGSLVWLTHAVDADCKVFSRALLAKSASIQTVVCFPLGDGVLEIGTTDLVRENPCLIHKALSIFIDTANSANGEYKTKKEDMFPMQDIPDIVDCNQFLPDTQKIITNYDNNEDYQMNMISNHNNRGYTNCNTTENHQDFNADLFKASSFHEEVPDRSWPEETDTSLEQICSYSKSDMDINSGENPSFFLPTQEQDNPYSRTVSVVLEQKNQMAESNIVRPVCQGAFSNWKGRTIGIQAHKTSQKILKRALLGTDCSNPNLLDEEVEIARVLANHRMAVTEKLMDQKLEDLHTLLPSSSFMDGVKADKVTVINEAIDYVKTLQKRTQELDVCKGDVVTMTSGRKRYKVSEDSEREMHQNGGEVSVAERNGVYEVQFECVWRHDVLIRVMQNLMALQLHLTSVSSSVRCEIISANLQATPADSEKGYLQINVDTVKAAVKDVLS